jgi:hypothetical protein
MTQQRENRPSRRAWLSRFAGCAALVLATASPALHAATLFYFDEADSARCVARTLELPSNLEHVLFSTKTCPTAMVFDAARQRDLFVEGGSLWSHRRGAAPTDLQRLARLPQSGPASVPVDNPMLWIESNGNARIAYLFDAAKAELEIETTGTGDDAGKIILFEGRRLEMQGLRAPFVALCEELRHDSWTRIETKATTSEFGDAWELNALDCFKARDSASNLADMLVQTTCQGLACKSRIDTQTKAHLPADANPYDEDFFGVLKSDTGGQFIFATGEGDTLHAVPPVYFCRGTCEHPTRLAGISDHSIALSLSGNYLFIASEYSNENPKVFDSRTGKLVLALPKARSAVWLPRMF